MAEPLLEDVSGDLGSLLLADLPVGKRDAPTGGDRHEQLIVSVIQAEGVFGIDEPPEILGRGGLIGGDRILDSGGNHGGRRDHAVSPAAGLSGAAMAEAATEAATTATA